MGEVVRVAVVGRTGRGNYGHAMDTAWLTVPGTRVVAVADENEQGRAAAAKRLGIETTYADCREMIAEQKPDVLCVAPRWIDQHFEMALAALERGIHVYVEKPFCQTLKQADALVDACERTHAKLAIAHPTRYSPKLDTLRRMIQQGRLGRVLEYRGRGKEDRRGGAEDLWVLGSHVFDMIHALGGKPEWCFARMTKNGKPVTKADVYDGNEGLGPLAGDGLDAVFGMPDGSRAHFASHRNMGGNPSRYGLQIFGSKGVVDLVEGTLPAVGFLDDPAWAPNRSGKTWQPVSSKGPGDPEPLTADIYKERHGLAIRDLLGCIGTDRDPKCSVYVGRDVVEMTMAVFESHRTGGRVNLPLESRDHPLERLA